jgi:HD-GYP domain-containing protein (c-di-GMP phosphodiesterase class II)
LQVFFEALTSTDRPYKIDKTLSETIEIMFLMKQKNQIAPGLFDLLLSSGIYLRYAENHLKPSQIDEVKIDKYVSP